ncbi:CPCC family cysteine-rich protein [Flavobacterium sp. DGU11]|uniref:CPCC family cysteine-rich protein n=1 Tax=Flavobacterium arundinis TaxID=3139143 RepID=A0ABU9HR41_9FLAO
MFKKNNFGKFQCPCCDYYTLKSDFENSFEMCDVCYWENDGIQLNDCNYEGGANRPSLIQARENFRRHGASEECLKEYVREPFKNEL